MKTVLSSFELRHLASELQFLVGAKIEKIFQQAKPKDDFLFSLHIPSKGKQFLFVSLPHLLCLSDFKPSFPDTPPGFCSALRRKITGARITSVTQHGFERIVVIGLSTPQGESKLVLELIPPGNMLLVDGSNKILSVLHPKIWNDERALLPAKQYVFPPLQLDPASLSFEQCKELCKQSNKESVVKMLAIDTSLGGVYAEEVLRRAKIEKSLLPPSLTDAQISALFDALHNLFAEKTKPFVYNGEAFPLLLGNISTEVSVCESFNEAVAKIALSGLTAAEEKTMQKENVQAVSKTEKVIRSQEQLLSGLERAQEENQQKGELIYQHYAQVKLLLDKILELRKISSWAEIKALCADISFIHSIDEHKGIVYVNLEQEQ